VRRKTGVTHDLERSDTGQYRESLKNDRMPSAEDLATILNVSRTHVVKLADPGELGALVKTGGGQPTFPLPPWKPIAVSGMPEVACW
jgi:hypothetical protein